MPEKIIQPVLNGEDLPMEELMKIMDEVQANLEKLCESLKK